jgi:hypothetical protein
VNNVSLKLGCRKKSKGVNGLLNGLYTKAINYTLKAWKVGGRYRPFGNVNILFWMLTKRWAALGVREFMNCYVLIGTGMVCPEIA